MENNYYKKVTLDKELADTFPEAKEIIPQKIEEWEQVKKELLSVVKKKLKIIKEKSAANNQWFWREWVKINEVQDLIEVNSHIARLKRLLYISNGQKFNNCWITEEQIQMARAVPIENIFSQRFRRSGKTLMGLCPFHTEKTPSFCIYLKKNTCWCFGCQQGGNTINAVKLLHGYSFKEAVQYLIGK